MDQSAFQAVGNGVLASIIFLIQVAGVACCWFIGHMIGEHRQPWSFRYGSMVGIAALLALMGAAQLGTSSSSPVPESMGGDEREIDFQPAKGERLQRATVIFICACAGLHFGIQRGFKFQQDRAKSYQEPHG